MKNIKDIVPMFFTMLLIVLIPKSSIAEQRMITYEMGDGAHQVSFPMSQKEILAAEKIDKLIKESNQRKHTKKIQWVEIHELANGHTIEFPMSDEKIRETKLRLQEQAAKKFEIIRKRKENKKEYEIYEMGSDGGNIVIFKSF
jgi:hypothetical protein